MSLTLNDPIHLPLQLFFLESFYSCKFCIMTLRHCVAATLSSHRQPSDVRRRRQASGSGWAAVRRLPVLPAVPRASPVSSHLRLRFLLRQARVLPHVPQPHQLVLLHPLRGVSAREWRPRLTVQAGTHLAVDPGPTDRLSRLPSIISRLY